MQIFEPKLIPKVPVILSFVVVPVPAYHPDALMGRDGQSARIYCVLRSSMQEAVDNIEAFALLPRDALHVAVIQRLGIDAIASDDRDFDRVKGVFRHWVINAPAE